MFTDGSRLDETVAGYALVWEMDVVKLRSHWLSIITTTNLLEESGDGSEVSKAELREWEEGQ